MTSVMSSSTPLRPAPLNPAAAATACGACREHTARLYYTDVRTFKRAPAPRSIGAGQARRPSRAARSKGLILLGYPLLPAAVDAGRRHRGAPQQRGRGDRPGQPPRCDPGQEQGPEGDSGLHGDARHPAAVRPRLGQAHPAGRSGQPGRLRGDRQEHHAARALPERLLPRRRWKHAPVVVANLRAAMAGRGLPASYDGYASCPLTTARNRMLLAEFDYTMKPHPAIPVIDTVRERYDMWLLKRYGLPFMYWKVMLKGLA